jgi:hypothetical protein
MKKLSLTAFALVLLAVLAAPAAAQQGRPHRRERNHIRTEEIQQSNATSVLELIQTLRPAWLSRNHPTDLSDNHADQLLVYVDRAPLSVAELGQVSLAGVRQIDFLSAGETELRLGRYSPNGAIVIVTVPPTASEQAQSRP